MAQHGLIRENKDIKRKAEALNRYGADASKQAPTNMFSKGPAKGGIKFKKAPSSNPIRKFFGL